MKHRLSLTIFLLTLFLASPAQAMVSLPVPFTSQAPFSDWREPWQNYCEEATIVMADFFYAEKKLDKYIARDQLLKAGRLKNKQFGWSLDEPAAKIVELINKYYPWEAYIVENPTLKQLKNEIDNFHPVIIPAHGRFLYNPHFRQGGPQYHTVVISGYEEETQEFIVQEPGTRHGLDFRYSFDTIMNAMHDFVPYKTATGQKRAIFTRKNLFKSALTDGDNDGLSKQDEIKHKTVLWLSDSDGDGHTDGAEVNSNYSPTLAEYKLPTGTLIKSSRDPKVYLLEKNLFEMKKRHIINEKVFLRNGWMWSDIVVVSDGFLEKIDEGKNIK